MLIVKLLKKESRFHLRRQEQEEQAFDERHPADEGDNNRERTARPDIVRENHRQPSRQRDYAEDQRHRWILKKDGHRLHDGLSANHHGQRDENAIQPISLLRKSVRCDMVPSSRCNLS